VTLSDHQAEFTGHVALLILRAREMGWRLRLRTVTRSEEEQARMVATGRSKTMNSKHRESLAVDAVLDLPSDDGWKYQSATPAYEPLGAYWESLSPYNTWGGRWTGFPDGNHFERDRGKRVEAEVVA